MRTKLFCLLFSFSIIGICNKLVAQTVDPQYLIFQLFTYSPTASGTVQPFDSNFIKFEIDSILTTVANNHGDGVKRQLGFAVGPLALDHPDSELRATISQSFKIAEEKNVAVVFSIDDCMFWVDRPDLWTNHANIEWTDWTGTVVPHNFVGWIPITLAPQMCYNSTVLRDSVQRIAKNVIGAEIKNGIDTLKAHGKYQLFGGVISGWETHLSDLRYVGDTTLTDSLGVKPRGELGYNALTNLGYSASNLPKNTDSVLERVVNGWTAFWSLQLQAAGVDSSRVYTHVAFPAWPSQAIEDTMVSLMTKKLGFPATILGFDEHVMPRTAFNNFSRPGFSTYPASFKVSYSSDSIDGLLAEILTEPSMKGQSHWASSEGTNINVATGHGTPSDLTWDEYLFDMYNNGASLVNIYAWNSGPGDSSTHSASAVTAYIKFLSGAALGINQVGGAAPAFTLSPNPASNLVTLEIHKKTEGPYSVKLYDLFGNVIYQTHFLGNIEHINLSECAAGIYFLQLQSESGTAVQKVIIQK